MNFIIALELDLCPSHPVSEWWRIIDCRSFRLILVVHISFTQVKELVVEGWEQVEVVEENQVEDVIEDEVAKNTS